jgi:hypothetical protein
MNTSNLKESLVTAEEKFALTILDGLIKTL